MIFSEPAGGPNMWDNQADLLTSGHSHGKAKPPGFQPPGPSTESVSFPLTLHSTWIWEEQFDVQEVKTPNENRCCKWLRKKKIQMSKFCLMKYGLSFLVFKNK